MAKATWDKVWGGNGVEAMGEIVCLYIIRELQDENTNTKIYSR
jgi:hypothetical protein